MMEERIDHIGFSGYRLIQRPKDFCYGIDAVLLADFAKVPPGGRVCDLGTGTGIIPLIMEHKTEAAELWGIELQETSWKLAQRSVELNGLGHKIHVVHGDVKDAQGLLGQGTFDTVVSNPPYMAAGGGIPGSRREKMLARHESSAGLSDFIEAAGALLRERGSFYMVHRPFRLVDIMACCRENRLEPKELRMISPKAGLAPNILLIHCVKFGGPELTVLPELSVYNGDGGYTDEILRIYERFPEGGAQVR